MGSFILHHFRWDKKYWIQEDSVLFGRLKHRKSPYQMHNINCLRILCGGSARRIVDVGMNIGMMTTEFSSWTNHISGFEPTPELFRYAKLNFEINGIHNVECHNAALGDVNGTHRLMVMKNDGAKNKLATDRNKNRNDAVFIEVPISTLDSFALTDVDAIKIDTEGSEYRILQGAAKTIAMWRPIVVVEILPEYLRMWKHTPQEIFDFFLRQDYEPVSHLRMPLPHLWTYRKGLSDVFFVPREKYKESYSKELFDFSSETSIS